MGSNQTREIHHNWLKNWLNMVRKFCCFLKSSFRTTDQEETGDIPLRSFVGLFAFQIVEVGEALALSPNAEFPKENQGFLGLCKRYCTVIIGIFLGCIV